MNVRYFLSPPQGQKNIGDHGQAYCLGKMFKNIFGNDNVFEYSVSETSTGLNEVKKDDIIFLSSGGNLGDIWLVVERERRRIIKQCRDNLIVSFPQTIMFSLEKEAEISAKIYNAHPNLYIFARDSKSYSNAKELFSSNTVQQLPAPVLTLAYLKNFKRNGVLCIFRNDKEDAIKPVKAEIVEYCKTIHSFVDIADTHLGYSINNREEELLSFLDKVSKYKLVVTDRFHGAVFASITGTPCLALPTINHKIIESNFWFRKFNTDTFVCSNINELKSSLGFNFNAYRYNPSFARALYSKVLNSIKNNRTVPNLNTVQDCLISRRTVRRWNNETISKEVLYDIIKAGIYAPSGSNAQCVKFKLVQDKDIINSLSRSCFGRGFIDAPPSIIMAGYDFGIEKTINFNHKNETWETLKYQDIAAAIQNMQLYCESIGLSCCWLSFFTDSRQKLLDSLSIKNNNIEYISGLAIGFAKSKLVSEMKHSGFLIKRRNIEHYLL